MIRLIEASNYRSLKYISQSLGDFHVLIGANATGKTTFLDTIKFISDIVNLGIDKAVSLRASYFDELTFAGKGHDVELAFEAELPINIKDLFHTNKFDTLRYELKVGIKPDTGELIIIYETLSLFVAELQPLPLKKTHNSFPQYLERSSILDKKIANPYREVISRLPTGRCVFNSEYEEASEKKAYWEGEFTFPRNKTALGNLPEDVTKFPASTWLKSFLQNGIQLFVLDSQVMRVPSPSGQSLQFNTDGSNLPWVIEDLKKNKKRFTQWIEHIQTALPDITDIVTIERPEDRKRYIKVIYSNGIAVPAWLVSDGTLRLLALTIPAYLSNMNGVYLIEEPENGIHPRAIETVYSSLSSVYNAQILLASHSSIILGMVQPKQLLCFAKTPEGVTDIVSGDEHPKLREWQGNPNLNYLFASGILS